LDSLTAKINENVEKINKWFGERLEWIEGIYDVHYKAQLHDSLTEKRDAALADLQ
jgi:hypothetical protein